jgi:multiple sugar transport system substrate-binding protein
MQSVLDLMLADYRARYPDIGVVVECSRGDYLQDVLTRSQSDHPPDVLWSLDLFTAQSAHSGLVMDVEVFAKADESIRLNDVNPVVLALGRSPFMPGLYMLPASFETVQMFYNKSLWQKSGAPLPAEDWVWDDLIAACKTIQEKNPDVKCLGFGAAGLLDFSWWAYLLPWIAGYGGKIVSDDFKTSTFSSPESLAGIKAYADLWLKHGIVITSDFARRGDCFVRQRCAAVFSIPGRTQDYRDRIKDFDWDVQIMPAHPKARVTGMGVYGWSIGKHSRQPEAAWNLIKFLITPAGQRAILENYAGVPLLESLERSETFERMTPPPANMRAFMVGSTIGMSPPNGYPLECGNLYSGLVSDAYRSALQDTIDSNQTAEDAFKAADAGIQACLDASK